VEPKNLYREKSSHSSFRHERHSVWSSLPVRLALAVGFLFLSVLGYERLRGKGNVQPSRPANASQSASLPAPPNNRPGQAKPKAEMQIRIPDTPVTDNPIRSRQSPENQPQPRLETSITTSEYVMERDSFGNIVGFGSINGIKVRFLADTGATMVVVPEKIAQQIGLKKGAPMPFKTGGGIVVHYLTTIDTLTLGRIEMRNVSAAINPAMQDEIVLLGMSALGLMDMQMEKGNLVLKYQATVPEMTGQQPVADEPFKRSRKDCVRQGNKFDKETLDCLRGK